MSNIVIKGKKINKYMVEIKNIRSIDQALDHYTHFKTLVDRADGVYRAQRDDKLGEDLIANIPVSQNGKRVYVNRLSEILAEAQMGRDTALSIGGFVVFEDGGGLLRYGIGFNRGVKHPPKTLVVAIQPILPANDRAVLKHIQDAKKNRGTYDLHNVHKTSQNW
jgi:hypothetical protein